jgi:hypothetical protein
MGDKWEKQRVESVDAGVRKAAQEERIRILRDKDYQTTPVTHANCPACWGARVSLLNHDFRVGIYYS